MKIVSARRFGLWTKLAQRWMKRQFAAIAALIDFTPVEEKIDDAKEEILTAIDEAVTPVEAITTAEVENLFPNNNEQQ